MITLTKPVIELKNIKHSEFASQETNCFEATIYVDGVRFAAVSNSGHGGCDMVHPFEGGYKAVEKLNERIAATFDPIPPYQTGGDPMKMDLELVCGDLLDAHLLRKDFKRTMKGISYVKHNESGVFQLPTKYKPTTKMIATIKQKASWAKDVTFLHDLPEEEAFKLYTA